jgi:hypothetical protein
MLHLDLERADINNALQPFDCTSPGNPHDGPNQSYLQQPAGQKSMFYIDGPGPLSTVNNNTPCKVGFRPMDSVTWRTNFKVVYTNNVTGYRRSVPYYVKIVFAPGRMLDLVNSSANTGSLP